VSTSAASRYRTVRDAKLSELTSGRTFRIVSVLLVAPGLVGIVYSLATGAFDIRYAIGVALALPAIHYAFLRKQAASYAKSHTMTAWAGEHGWTYVPEPEIPTDVAFCRDKSEMEATDGFEGTICGLPGMIFNFTYSTFSTQTSVTSDGWSTTSKEEKKQRHTVLRLELGPIPGVPTMQLADRGIGFLEKLEAAFGSHRRVETESVEFDERFSLSVDDMADQLSVLRIFTPALQMRLLDGAFPHTTFQFEAGALSYIWPDQYHVEELEEIETRIAAVTPLTAALNDAVTDMRLGAAT